MSIVESIRSGKDTKEKASFVNLVAVALADGHITHEEYDLLYIIGKRFGAAAEEVDEIITAYQLLHFEAPDNDDEKLTQFINLIRMMLADGVVDANELKLINSFATGLGFDQARTNVLIRTISEMVVEENSDGEILNAIR
ncbi:MAG: TerB family tellurite resistance protein [Bacteroidota bacterium]